MWCGCRGGGAGAGKAAVASRPRRAAAPSASPFSRTHEHVPLSQAAKVTLGDILTIVDANVAPPTPMPLAQPGEPARLPACCCCWRGGACVWRYREEGEGGEEKAARRLACFLLLLEGWHPSFPPASGVTPGPRLTPARVPPPPLTLQLPLPWILPLAVRHLSSTLAPPM